MAQQFNRWTFYLGFAAIGVFLLCEVVEWQWRSLHLSTVQATPPVLVQIQRPADSSVSLTSNESPGSVSLDSDSLDSEPIEHQTASESVAPLRLSPHDQGQQLPAPPKPEVSNPAQGLFAERLAFLAEASPQSTVPGTVIVRVSGDEEENSAASKNASNVSDPQAGARLEAPALNSPRALPEKNEAKFLPDDQAAQGNGPENRGTQAQLSSSRTEVKPDAAASQKVQQETLAQNAKQTSDKQLSQTSPWPKPNAVLQQIELLREDPRLHAYLGQIEGLLQELQKVPSLADPKVGPILESLATRAGTLPAIASELPTRTRAILTEVRFAIRKRVAIWSAVHFASMNRPVNWVATNTVDPQRLVLARSSVSNISQLLTSDQAGVPWHEYLAIPELEKALSDGEISDAESDLIRQVLRRLESSQLSLEQREFLAQPPMDSLVLELGPLVKEELTYEQLLKVLEAYEANPIGLYEQALARALEALKWSEQDREVVLAEALEVNYRNANMRFTVSEEFMNRMLPEMGAIREPVNDRMLGAKVTGTSETSNRLKIHLVPDESRLHFGLQANGVVLSRTRAMKDGFVFYNRGQAKFRASKFLSFDRDGILLTDSDAEAVSAQETTNVESDYDGVPVIGHFARMLAMQQKSGKERAANRIVEQKVANTARERLDDEIHEKLLAARQRLNTEVIEPLHEMGLEPQPIALETTADRMVVRYRLAGPEQLASYSPRPQALSNSLVSFQLHESVISNFAGGLELGGQEFDLPELVEHLADKLGQPITLEQEVEQKLHVMFPKAGWLQARFDEGKVRIQLTFKELSLDEGKPWKNLTVEAIYLPMIDGSQLRLFRDPEEAIVVKGRRLRMRDQFAIRGIMNTVFDPRQVIDVIPEPILNDPRLQGTTIGQLTIENGWIAVSIVDLPKNFKPVQNSDDKEALQPVRQMLNEILR